MENKPRYHLNTLSPKRIQIAVEAIKKGPNGSFAVNDLVRLTTDGTTNSVPSIDAKKIIKKLRRGLCRSVPVKRPSLTSP